jgi:hypothetical protein
MLNTTQTIKLKLSTLIDQYAIFYGTEVEATALAPSDLSKMTMSQFTQDFIAYFDKIGLDNLVLPEAFTDLKVPKSVIWIQYMALSPKAKTKEQKEKEAIEREL